MPEKFESQSIERKVMPCGYVDKKITDLEGEEWEYDYSFHDRQGFTEQWNEVCDRVERLQKDGFWEAIIVAGQSDLEKMDGVAYVYKRKNKEKWEEYEKDRKEK